MHDFDTHGEIGDRRQEIVFIGVGMDETAIVAQLDGALLTDDEMVCLPVSSISTREPDHEMQTRGRAQSFSRPVHRGLWTVTAVKSARHVQAAYRRKHETRPVSAEEVRQ